jgi:hypothetical protein
MREIIQYLDTWAQNRQTGAYVALYKIEFSEGLAVVTLSRGDAQWRHAYGMWQFLDSSTIGEEIKRASEALDTFSFQNFY